MSRDFLAELPTTVAEFGLTWLGQSSVLLGIGLMAGRALRSRGPAVQSAVYRTTLAAVLICPVVSALLAAAGVDGVRLRLPVGATAAVAETARSRAVVPDPTWIGSPIIDPQPVRHDEEPRPARALAPGAAEPPAPAASVSPPPPDQVVLLRWLSIVLALGLATWAGGAAGMVLRLILAAGRMRRLRAGAIPAEPTAAALCGNLAAGMRLSPPRVLRSPFLASPCVAGLRRPAILLPEDAADLDLRATFVHELAHLGRRDGLWNLLRRVATALLWFQPLLWALSRRLEVTAEEVCDDHVVQHGADRARYADLLVDLAARSLPPLSPTGVGMVSLRSLLARRVVRIMDSSRTLSIRAGTRAVLMSLCVGLVGTLGVGMLAVAAREPRLQADEPRLATLAPTPDSGTETNTGRAVDSNGRPIAGAIVRVLTSWNQPHEPGVQQFGPIAAREIGRAVADADGRYSMTYANPKLGPDGKPRDYSLAIEAPGYGMLPVLRDRQLPLVADDVPVLGRVVDLEGKPVAGATVRPTQIWMPWPETRQLPPTGPVWFAMTEIIGYGQEWCALRSPLTTDADGRFRVDGLGRDRMVGLEITGPNLALKRVNVVTREMGHQAGPPGDVDPRIGINEPGQYGAHCTIVVEPTRVIEGTVRDIVTGAPIPGAIITARRTDEANILASGDIMARTDAQGRYRLVGLPKAKAPTVAVYPPLDQPYFPDDFLEVPVGPGYEPIRFDIPLRRGQWITGRVVDLRTNKPVAAAVDYFPMITNQNAAGYPNFDPEIASSVGISDRYQTGADGRYRVVGIAGQGVVTARPKDGTYRAGFGSESIAGQNKERQLPTYHHIFTWQYSAIRAVNLPATGATVDQDLPLDPGDSVVLRLVDEAGQPIRRAYAWGRNPYGADGSAALEEETHLTVAGLLPGKPRTVVLEERNRRIGQVVELPADGPRGGQEQTVVLRPMATVTARFVAAAFPQNVGVRIEARQAEAADNAGDQPQVNHQILIRTVAADAQGRLRFDALAPGGTYRLEASDRPFTNTSGRNPRDFRSFLIAENLTVRPGATIDLGTFDVTTGQRVEAPRPATTAAPTDRETLTGQVVGPDGRPIPGAVVRTISGRTVRGEPDQIRARRLEARELARTVADADGRYTISYPKPQPGPDGQSFSATGFIETFAQAPGFGPSPSIGGRIWPLVPDDVPITGRLVDPEGNPVAEASVRVRWMDLPRPDRPAAPGSLTGWFDTTSEGNVRFGSGVPDLTPPITSDTAGRFRIEGIGRGRLVDLEISGPKSALKRVQVVTRAMDRVAAPPRDSRPRSWVDEPGQYGANCVVVLEPARPIEGVVRDVDTGEPIPDALISLAQLDATRGSVIGDITARTDARGRYRLGGLPKSDAPIIQVYPPLDRPYFANRRLKVPVTPGYEPVVHDVALKRGLWVSGRVTNVKTGEPVAATVEYFPFLDNPAAGADPTFDPNILALGNMTGRQHRTDRDGRFRVVALPGRGVVTARTDDGSFRVGVGAEAIPADPNARRNQPGQLPTYDRIFTNNYQSIQAVDIPPGGPDFARDLPVDPGGSVLLHLVDAEGQPVNDASIPLGRYPRGGESGSQNLYEQTTVRIGGLEPGLGRTVLIKQAARGLGVRLEMPADGPSDGRDQTVVLRPLATIAGRIVDREGRPVAGEVEVRLTLAGVASPQMRDYRLDHASLDAAGRFRSTGLPAGGEYTIRVAQPIDARNPTQGLRRTPFAAQVKPQPGETLDLGTRDVSTSQPIAAIPAAAPVQLPAAPLRVAPALDPAVAAGRLQPERRPIRPAEPPDTTPGRVVDAEGRPIAGADVRAIEARSVEPTLDRPWVGANYRELARTRTDAEGRFVLASVRPNNFNLTQIYVTAAGYGPARGERDLEGDYEIKLPRDDVPVLGRLIDLEGRPVAGASVRVAGVRSPSATAARAGADPAWFVDTNAAWVNADFFFPRPVATDGDGRFRLDGIGRDRRVTVEITGPTIAHRRAAIVSRRGGWIADPDPEPSTRMAGDDPGQHGAECTIFVEPTRVVAGVIRDAATGVLIPGALVVSAEIRRGFHYNEGLVADRTDVQGHYRLVGLPRDAISISIYPPADRPYFVTQLLPIPASPGAEPITLDVPLQAGIWITGRVTERRTNEPVAATVQYSPRLDNPVAPTYHNYQPDVVHVVGMFPPARTDAQGRYRVVGLLGRGMVAARVVDTHEYVPSYGVEEVLADPTTPKDLGRLLPTYNRVEFPHYQAIRAVDVPAGVAEFVRDVPVVAGGRLVLRPLDAAGQPLPGVFVHGINLAGGPSPIQARGGDGPTITLVKLEPGVARAFVLTQAFFPAPEMNPPAPLAAVLEQPADLPLDGRAVTVTLRLAAQVVGRIVDAAGEPVAGRVIIEVRPAGVPPSARALPLATVAIGVASDGRFRVAGIPGGVTATVRFRRADQEREDVFRSTPVDLMSGATVDVGTLDAATGKPVRR